MDSIFFLSCGHNESRTQLVTLNRDEILHSLKQQKGRDSAAEQINVNILFLDSLSRAHFYRSLKRTVKFMNRVNTDPTIKSEILDFELFQSIHGHTTENMFALLNGKKFPSSMTDSDKESSQTNVQQFLKFIKDRGYDILYQEDECWQGLWGLFTDLGEFDGWKDYYEQVKTNSSIDDTGLSFAACKVVSLHEPEAKHVFNTDEKTCYNGLNLGTYFLRYLSNKIKSSKSPLFSFTGLNVAHDPNGKRVQGIDEHLKQYLESTVKSDNTLTIIFSDHGNTYTEYVYLDIEGRYEMYHPTLFMVIPDGVQQKLGHQIMHNMRKNQNRLLNLVDIHHTIKHIVDRNHPNKGILQVLSSNRTCADIPMAMPNLCVCDGWDSPVDNTTELMPFVEFAIGHINNIISNASPNMKCKRLVPTSFQNVMQRKNGDDAILKFDIITLSGPGSKNNEERISVEVSYKFSDSLRHFDTKLVSYDRISKFGEYRSCSDAETKFRYCVCNMDNHDVTATLTSFLDLSPVRNDYVYSIFDGNIEEEIFNYADGKLGLVKRNLYAKTDDEKDRELVTTSYEVINLSQSQQYEVAIEFDDAFNMKRLTNDDCTGIIKPNNMLYLCTVKRKWTLISGSIDTNFTYTKFD